MPPGLFTIPASHPALPGHFPGRPIVPGVVLLDEVFGLICQHYPAERIASLSRVKFTRPVRPDQAVTVTASRTGATVSFACAVDGMPVLSGTVLVGPG